MGWSWTALMVILTTVPYLWARAAAPAGATYTWILPPYPEDALAYLAWTRQAAGGRILMSLKYTALPHAPFVFQPYFLVAGLLSRVSSIAPGVALLVLKTVGVVCFCVAFLSLLRSFDIPRRAAATAVALVTLSSGLGAPFLLLAGPDAASRVRPADLSLVDLNTLRSLVWNPLFPFSLALMLVIVRWTCQASTRRSSGLSWAAGAATGLLALIHPYVVPLLFLFMIAVSALRLGRECWRAWVPFAVAAAPAVAFVTMREQSNPLLAAHAVTGRMPSPSPLALAFGLGLIPLFVVAGLFRGRAPFARAWPLLLWVGLAVCLAYMPVWFQQKFLFGVHVPLCILGGLALDGLFRRSTWIVLAVALTVPTTLFLVVETRAELFESTADGPYYLSPDLSDALAWLRGNAPPSSVVLATYDLSRVVPAVPGNTVVWGHWAQSVDLQDQMTRLRPALDPGASPDSRKDALWGMHVAYVLVDPWLRARLGDPPPEWLVRSARPVYRRGVYTILQRVEP